jgi:hypothetical protein
MYLNYCRSLRFEESPDYMYLRQLFRWVTEKILFSSSLSAHLMCLLEIVKYFLFIFWGFLANL